MYCKKCGKMVEDGSAFCPYCGADLREQQVEEVKENEEAEVLEATPTNEDNGPWKVFALVGFILGIVSLAGSIFMLGLTTGVPGIVFSILGKKSNNPDKQEKAAKGLKLSIWGLIVSCVVYLALVIVISILVMNGVIDEEALKFLEFLGIDIDVSR